MKFRKLLLFLILFILYSTSTVFAQHLVFKYNPKKSEELLIGRFGFQGESDRLLYYIDKRGSFDRLHGIPFMI